MKSISFANGDLRTKPRARFEEGSLFLTSDGPVDSVPEQIDHYSPPAMRATEVDAPSHLKVERTRETHLYESDQRGLPRALVFHNSYGLWVAPFLAQYFSRAAFVWCPDVSRSVVEAERPDVVIQLTVDRFLRLVPKE